MNDINKNAEVDEEKSKEAEQTILLTIFPEEIWIKMFDFLDKPEVLTNLSNAFIFFSELLESRKAIYLFPQILPIFEAQKYLTKSNILDLLNFRLVCKAWRLGVNCLLESQREIHYASDNPFSLELCNDIAYPTYFRLDNQKILNNFESEILPRLQSPIYQTICPFPSRFVEINEYKLVGWLSLEALERFREITKQLLQEVGRHFWYAIISVGMNTTVLERYNLIVGYLNLMPNLKSFYFNWIGCGPCICKDLFEGPTFPKLEQLELMSLNNAPVTIINRIVDANRLAKNVVVRAMCLDTSLFELRRALNSNFDDVKPEVLNLANLRDPEYFCIELRSQVIFRNLPENWNLKSLRLGLRLCCVLLYEMESIFEKLESYQNSLIELYLELPEAQSENEKLMFLESSRTLQLNLPNLKRVEIKVHSLCSLDFLLELSSLEFLCIDCPAEVNDGLPVTPDYGSQGRIGFMEQCNLLFDEIPSLEKVDLKGRGGSRSFTRGN